MSNFKDREPVVLAGLILTLIPAAIGLLAAFDVWDPTNAQISAITTLYVALASVVIYVLRGKVWSPAGVAGMNAKTEKDRQDELQLISDSVALVESAPTDEDAVMAREKLGELLPEPQVGKNNDN